MAKLKLVHELFHDMVEHHTDLTTGFLESTSGLLYTYNNKMSLSRFTKWELLDDEEKRYCIFMRILIATLIHLGQELSIFFKYRPKQIGDTDSNIRLFTFLPPEVNQIEMIAGLDGILSPDDAKEVAKIFNDIMARPYPKDVERAIIEFASHEWYRHEPVTTKLKVVNGDETSLFFKLNKRVLYVLTNLNAGTYDEYTARRMVFEHNKSVMFNAIQYENDATIAKAYAERMGNTIIAPYFKTLVKELTGALVKVFGKGARSHLKAIMKNEAAQFEKYLTSSLFYKGFGGLSKVVLTDMGEMLNPYLGGSLLSENTESELKNWLEENFDDEYVEKELSVTTDIQPILTGRYITSLVNTITFEMTS